MTKQRLIKKVSIFSAVWFVIIYALITFLPFHYFNREYPIWKSKMDVLSQQDSGYSNFIIGDSRAIAGIDPKVLGSNYYNLALGGSTPMEGYHTLKKLIENKQKIDTVVVSYTPSHFEQSEMFWERQVKYRFYDLAEINTIFDDLNSENEIFWQYEGESNFSDEEKPGLLKKAYLNYFRFPTQLRAEFSRSLFLRGYTNYQVFNDIKQRKGSYDFGMAKASYDLNVEAQRENFHPKKIMVKSLRMLFELAESHNVEVVYTSIPMNETSYQAMNNEYRLGIEEFEKNLRADFPKINFVTSRIMAYRAHFFGDASHLNSDGRLKFSNDLKTQLSPDIPTRNSAVTETFFEDE